MDRPPSGDGPDAGRPALSGNVLSAGAFGSIQEAGAYTGTFTEEITLAGGSTAQYGLTEPVEIRWKDRRISLRAVVMPNASEILPGALPRPAPFP